MLETRIAIFHKLENWESARVIAESMAILTEINAGETDSTVRLMKLLGILWRDRRDPGTPTYVGVVLGKFARHGRCLEQTTYGIHFPYALCLASYYWPYVPRELHALAGTFPASVSNKAILQSFSEKSLFQ